MREATRRTLVWVEAALFRGWGCSDCAWLFNPPGSPTGDTLDEMKENYERQRDNDFLAHRCSEHPRSKATKAR